MGFTDVIKQIGRGAVNVVTGRNKPAQEQEQRVKYAEQQVDQNQEEEALNQEIADFRKEQETRKLRERVAAQRQPIRRTFSRATLGTSTPGEYIERGVTKVPGGYRARRFDIVRKGSVGQRRQKYGRTGRPKGTVKYFIPGVGAVGVYQYRAWLRDQKRTNKLRFQQQLTQNPQLARQYAMAQASQQMPQESPQMPYNQSYSQHPQNYPQEQKVSQYIEPTQTHGLNLWDSNWSMTGDMPLVGSMSAGGEDLPLVGGSLGLFTPFGNMGNQGPTPNQNEPAQPYSNPQSEFYLDVDLLTGKQVLKKRW